ERRDRDVDDNCDIDVAPLCLDDQFAWLGVRFLRSPVTAGEEAEIDLEALLLVQDIFEPTGDPNPSGRQIEMQPLVECAAAVDEKRGNGVDRPCNRDGVAVAGGERERDWRGSVGRRLERVVRTRR